MKRTLMFTAYELIICVTPRATGSKLALSGKKQKTIQPSTPRCSGGYYSAKSNAKKLAIFFQSEHKRHWGRVQDNTTHLSTMKPLNSGHLRVLKNCPLLRGARYWEIV